jgi:hypothetical protein
MVLEGESRSNRGSDEGASQQSPGKVRNGWSPGVSSSVGGSSCELSDMDEDLDEDDDFDDVSLDSRKSGKRSPRSATSANRGEWI